jgi:manganese/zinc/iron transport system permease protein
MTRTHRLWELFLIQGANIASDHVDRDADAIEHLLPPEMVDGLEAALSAQGRLPSVAGDLPESPHELPAQSAARSAAGIDRQASPEDAKEGRHA